MTTRVAGRYAMWAAVLAIGLSLGCGDSAASDGDDGEPPPECLSPGALGMCLCVTMVQGTRSCQEDGTWTDCSCPPPHGDPNACLDGERFMCPPCAGEAEGEIVECPPSHVIVCCGGGGDGGAITDGMVPTPVDAGQDAGQDAASGSDGG